MSRNMMKKITSIIMLLNIFIISVLNYYIPIRAYEYENTRRGIITDPEGYVNVRTSPTTSTTTNISGIVLDYGDMLTVTGEEYDLDGKTDGSGNVYVWYHVSGYKNGSSFVGYVRGDLMTVYESAPVGDKAAIKEELLNMGFPEGYAEPLSELKSRHSNWNFVPFFTGCDWNEFVSKQLEGTRNLVDDSDPSSWKSMDYGSFDWVNNRWVVQEGNARVKASREIIEYFLDPRNFFTDNQIFQFELLGFDGSVHSETGVEKILNNSFMSNTVLSDDSEGRTYARTFMQVGSELGMSPYYLASKVLLEQGRAGTSLLISGTYPGYEGYYNYYNIGATGVGDTAIIVNGLQYAKNQGWNSRISSIKGGASGTIKGYIDRGQNTLYLQRFDVVDFAKGSWLRQYAQYVWSANTEAQSSSGAYYSMGIEDSDFTFRIPIYNNMPGNVCEKPTKDGNPNYKLSNITIEGYNLSPSFDTDITEYSLIVEADRESVNINAASYASTTNISGLGNVSLNPGANVVRIVSTAQNGDSRTYTVNITKKEGNPNQLSSLDVLGHSISPAFNSDTYEYTLIVPYTTTSINVGAASFGAQSEVLGTGVKEIEVGENTIAIIVNASDGSTNTYVIKVIRTDEPVATFGSHAMTSQGYLHGFTEGQNAILAISDISVSNGTKIIVDANGNEVDGPIGTGQKLRILDLSGNVRQEFEIVLYGDVNGDGKISLIDRTILKRYLWGEYDLGLAYIEAADCNHDGKVSLIDRTYLKQAIWKMYDIIQ